MEKLLNNKTLGPDAGWILHQPETLQAFCQGEGKKLVHRGRKTYNHVCAYYGEWAFDAQDSTYIRCVTFLHYRTPSKAAAMLGDVDEGAGTKVFTFSGDDLWATYKSLLDEEDGVHVWQRASHGEIAIDFCLVPGGGRKANSEARLVLPDFIPK
jgi:hypothetical protein